jgi:regulator of sigma E protease
MLATFFSILGAIGLLLVLIIVHEAGHFFAARYFGMQTPVVGLGLPFLGPTWKMGKFQDVEFRLHPLLLGAYVAIPEMDDESGSEEEMDIKLTVPKKQFPAWQRMVVSFAGPGANIAFAFILALMTVIFLGVPDQKVAEDFFITQISSSASKEVQTKLKPGDQILGVEKELVKNSSDFRKKLESRPEQNTLVWLQRSLDKSRERFACFEETVKTDSAGHFKVSLSADKVTYTPVTGTPVISHLEWAWKYFFGWFMFCINGLWFLISAPFKHLIDGPKIQDVHGVIFATGKVAEFLKQNASSALQWGALFSIELGIFNLIPILPLDGGHILFQGGEIISRGRKLPQLKQYIAQTGLVLILALTCLIVFNDLRDLIFPAKL